MKRLAAIANLILLAGILLPGKLFAQYESEKEASVPLEYFYIKKDGPSIIRKILSKVTFGISTGYGNTTFKHELNGFGIIQNPDSIPKLFQKASVSSGYSNWTNKVVSSGNTSQPGSFSVAGDTTKLGFKAKGFNIPIRATLHVDFNNVRVGGGYSFEYVHLGTYNPVSYADRISSYNTSFSSFFMQKYFGTIGGTVYRYDQYLLVVDANIGGYTLGSNYDKSLIKRGIFLNVGASVERELSEYLRAFIRPSYEIKSYKISFPETSQSLTHKMNAFYINVGVTYRIPELRRCFLKTCHAQMNHAHGNKEYRSRVHPIYKKQNPHYGENYPNLIKYKGKNKNKLNPY